MTQQNIKGATPKPTESSSKKRAARTTKTELEGVLESAPVQQYAPGWLTESPHQARKKKHDPENIRQLADSIAAVGLLQNLVGHVMPDGKVGIAAGGGRRAAIELLVSEGHWPAGRTVPVLIIPEAMAKAVSLTENGRRYDMHPADQITGFSSLAQDGHTAAQIAGLLGYRTRHVERLLGMAALAPFLLELLASDVITLDHCQVMTLTADHARQAQVWELAKSKSWESVPSVSSLRYYLTQGETEISGNAEFAFIGREAYLAAGGSITTDLFSAEDEGLADSVLIRSLLEKKLQAMAADIATREGWEWHTGCRERLYDHGVDEKNYRLSQARTPVLSQVQLARAEEIEQLNPGAMEDERERMRLEYRDIMEAGLLTAWQDHPREHCGVVVSWLRGEPFIQRGVYRITEEEHTAREEREKTMKKEKMRDNPVEAVPATLVKALSCERSLAVQAALSTQAEVSVALLTWQLCRSVFNKFGSGSSPSHVQANGQTWSLKAASLSGDEGKAYRFLQEQQTKWSARLPEDWNKGFSWLLTWPAEDRLALLGFVAAQSVGSVQDRQHGITGKSALEEAERATDFCLTDWWQPTAQNYFGRTGLQQIITDLLQAGREEQAREAAKLKKGEAAKLAETTLAAAGWVPAWMTAKRPESPATPEQDVMPAQAA